MSLWGRFLREASETTCYTNISKKFISTSCMANAGFQGRSGISASSEMRQSQITRKRRVILKLEKMPLQQKPVQDFQIKYSWKTEPRQRSLEPLTAEELERRILLQKEWSKFVTNRKKKEDEKLLILKESQETALYELRLESEELYLAATEVDENLFPFAMEGPTETPPNKNYVAPLGTYIQREEEN
ncbi:large ribosomal subunit protein mL40-like [Styela clava]